MRIKESVVILAITGSIISTPLDQVGIGLHAGAFKMFVHFFRNSFFPVTKCEIEYVLTTMTMMIQIVIVIFVISVSVRGQPLLQNSNCFQPLHLLLHEQGLQAGLHFGHAQNVLRG